MKENNPYIIGSIIVILATALCVTIFMLSGMNERGPIIIEKNNTIIREVLITQDCPPCNLGFDCSEFICEPSICVCNFPPEKVCKTNTITTGVNDCTRRLMQANDRANSLSLRLDEYTNNSQFMYYQNRSNHLDSCLTNNTAMQNKLNKIEVLFK